MKKTKKTPEPKRRPSPGPGNRKKPSRARAPLPAVLHGRLKAGVTRDSLEAYLAEIGKLPLLSQEEEKNLGRRAQKGDEEAVGQLVLHNLRFVVAMAKKYRSYSNSIFLSDLINEGNVGLIEAARRFDPSRDVRFITYAMWWVRQSILHALADFEKPLKLPAKKASLAHQIARTVKEMRFESQRDPRITEIAERMKVTPEEIHEIYSMREESLDEVLDDESGMTRLDTLAQETVPSAEDILFEELLVSHVDEMLHALAPREEEVLRLRFGLDTGEVLTLEDIGARLHLSRERVRQIEKSALNKLRRGRMARQLKDYWH
jgi:RNA polymerase primary sigma factor